MRDPGNEVASFPVYFELRDVDLITSQICQEILKACDSRQLRFKCRIDMRQVHVHIY